MELSFWPITSPKSKEPGTAMPFLVSQTCKWKGGAQLLPTAYKAAFICLTYSPMYGGASLPYRSSSLTMAEPTMAPSEMSAIFFACSGVEMPNPMAQGIRVFSRTTFIMAARSVLISLLTPVTPRLETI